MADNTTLNTGTGGDIIASDDIGGVKHQRVKVSVGADGSATDAVPVSNGMDVTGAAVVAVGIVGQYDDTLPGAVTENQFAPVRISSRRALLVEGVASGTVIPVSDGGGALTVDGTVAVSGTVAVTQSGTWDEVGINDSGNSITVDWAGTAPPIGAGLEATALRVTLATDSTGLVSVDDNGGSLTVDGTVSVSGTVTVDGSGVTQPVSNAGLTALNSTIVTEDAAAAANPTGITPILVRADTPGAVASANGDNVAQRGTDYGAAYVQIVSSAGAFVDSFGGGTQYTEDAAAAADPVGTVPILVRADTPGAIVSANGDNVAQRGTNYGASFVQVVSSSGAFIDSFGGSGGTAMVDDAAFTPATTTFTPVGGTFDDVTPDSVNEGDGGAFRMSANRSLYVNIRDNAGNERGLNVDASGFIGVTDGGGSLTVDGTVAVSGTVTVGSHAVTNAGTFATQVDGAALTALQLIDNLVLAEDAVHASTDPGVQLLAVRKATPANLSSADGDYEPLQVSAGKLWVSATVDAALPAGTNNIGDVDVLTLPNVTLAAGTNTNEVVGDVAHDAAASGNPVMVAGAAQTTDDTAPPNRVSAEGDSTRLATTLDGAIFCYPHGPQIWTYHSNGSTALTDATVHAAPGAGLSLYVTDITVSSGAATAMNAFFEEGASTVLGPYYLEAVAGRGLHIQFKTPKKITANTALTVTTSAAIAHCVDVQGFTAPS